MSDAIKEIFKKYGRPKGYGVLTWVNMPKTLEKDIRRLNSEALRLGEGLDPQMVREIQILILTQDMEKAKGQ